MPNEEQARIDATREAMADEIIAGAACKTVDEWKRFARAWIITAAQSAANELFYMAGRDAAEQRGYVRAMMEAADICTKAGLERGKPDNRLNANPRAAYKSGADTCAWRIRELLNKATGKQQEVAPEGE